MHHKNDDMRYVYHINDVAINFNRTRQKTILRSGLLTRKQSHETQ